MSLQVWLPLNGNLNNQGLASVTVTNNGAVVASAGKIGQCYQFTPNQWIRISLPSHMTTIKNTSICAWVKSTSSTMAVGGISNDTSNATCMTLYSSGWQFRGSDAWKYIGGGTVANTAVWHHVACTLDDNTIITYLDGVKVNTNTLTGLGVQYTDLNITTNFIEIGCDHPGGDEYLTGYVNDFRVYDHALSAKEINELSKALVLHYKLDGNIDGNENLFRGSAMTSTDRNGFASSASTDWTKYLRYYNGSTSIHSFSEEDGVGQDTITLNSGGNLGICFARSAEEIDLDPDSYYTISCWAKSTQIAKPLCIGLSYYNDANTWVWRGGSNPKTFSAANTWQKFTLTFKPDANTQYICYCFTVVGVANGTDTFTIKECKLEKGENATSWKTSPLDSVSLGTKNDIEYDCSGYGHNGTVSGTLTNTSDSPRYNSSTHIGATSAKIHTSGLTTSGFGNSYSFAWWGKRTSNSPMFWGFSDGIRLNGMYLGNLWNTGDGSNNPLYKVGTTTQVTVPSVNAWHHYVMTGNGTKCYVYLDGALWAEAKTYKAISGTSLYINGWDGGTSYCSDNTDISDFRIYATALSAEDVLELYHTSASIDNKGNVYSYEVME